MEIYRVNGDDYEKMKDEYLPLTYQTYMYTSPFGEDLSGYFVNSSKPIAVYGGHACAFVPEGRFFCDHVVEQIAPVSELGNLHIVPPIIGRDPDAGYAFRVKPRLHDTTGCQSGCITGLTTGLTTVLNCSFNRLSYRVVQPYNRFDNRLYTRYNRLSNRLSNRFDNRLYRVNGA